MAENLSSLCCHWANAIWNGSRWGSQAIKTLLTALSKGKIYKKCIKCTQLSSPLLLGCVGSHWKEICATQIQAKETKQLGWHSWICLRSLSPNTHGWYQAARWRTLLPSGLAWYRAEYAFPQGKKRRVINSHNKLNLHSPMVHFTKTQH